ncbi:hypothetical protein CVT24_010468 [Panaeolus cyanescens]|uniref:Electron transfer flavoprotein-ubiquinone oxidoreductase n=1 Tax=Panaeolus cyanescens TaxID=181874 RepID=A0A409W995_9AGAR|nr:hypothetical protein CVT24_010468 [Panaeolus cyanescens]
MGTSRDQNSGSGPEFAEFHFHPDGQASALYHGHTLHFVQALPAAEIALLPSSTLHDSRLSLLKATMVFLKQLEREKGNEIRMAVLENGSEIGSHTVIESGVLDGLIPEWRAMDSHPLTQPATSRACSLSTNHGFAMICFHLRSSFSTHSGVLEDPHVSLDSTHTSPASQFQPIEYPPFEAHSTDLMTSVALTGTIHDEDQSVHLRVVKTTNYMSNMGVTGSEDAKAGNVAVGSGAAGVTAQVEVLKENEEGVERDNVERELETRREHVRVNVQQYAGLLGRAYPAGVYEYVADEAKSSEVWNGHKLVINSQLCDVKVADRDEQRTLERAEARA